MPAVNVAMERSLRAGFADLLLASLRPVFERRDVISDAEGQISDFKTAISSWGNCMSVAYCKWTIIGIMIVGGLIVFSLVWCIIRCACCGLSCCCSCFQCLKCCGNCCGCCDPPRKKHQYLDEPYIPPHHAAGYKSHDPMVAGPAAPFPISPVASFPTTSAAAAAPPQYAEFDFSKKGGSQVHEDALPEMPSWEGAGSKKVLLEDDGEAVEMDQLKKPEAVVNGQNVPLMTGASAVPGPVSPVPSPDNRSPYSPPGSTGVAGGYMAAGRANTDPYSTNARGYNNVYGNGAGGYDQSAASLGTGQGYGMGSGVAPAAQQPLHNYNNDAGYGRSTPGQDGYQNTYAGSAAAGYGNYGQPRQGSYENYGHPGNQGYGRGQDQRPLPQGGPVRQNTGGYPQERMTRSPAPMTSEYGGNYNSDRSYSPAPVAAPQRQQTYEMPVEPTNNASFDFNSDYSRPTRTTPANDFGRSVTPGHDNGYGSQQQQQPSRQQPGQYSGYRGW